MNNTWALIKDMFSKGVLFGGDLGGYTAPTNVIPSAVKDPAKAMRGGDANFYYNTKIPLKGKSKDRQRMSNNETKFILESKKKPVNGYNVKSSTGYNIQEPGVGFGEPFTTQRSVSTSKSVPSVLGASQPATFDTDAITKFAKSWYTSKGHPDSAKKAKLVAQKSLEYGLDPYMMLALGAQEGGWLKAGAGKNNYFGLGETDSGSMGMGSDSIDGWLDKYLPTYNNKVYGEDGYGKRNNLKDWGGSLEGKGKGSSYKYRYNYNDSWYSAIQNLLSQQEAYRQQYFSNLPSTRIKY